MKQILILGGTGDGLRIAAFCHALCGRTNLGDSLSVVYSIAGVARKLKTDCQLRVGGFGGWQGLQRYILDHSVVLLVDVTHPYASSIKLNACKASREANIPLYRYIRPAWKPHPQDCWHPVASVNEILASLSGFKRPFFSIGSSALKFLQFKHHAAYANQHWTLRYLQAADQQDHASFRADDRLDISVIDGVGPFTLEEELALLHKHKIDLVIAKNSGGDAVIAKIVAARQLELPVLMLDRPQSAKMKCQFDQLNTFEAELSSFIESYADNYSLLQSTTGTTSFE